MRTYQEKHFMDERWVQERLEPSDAIMRCLHKYFDPTRRASRSEYWWWMLFLVIFLSAAHYLSRLLEFPWVFYTLAILTVLPTVMVSIRRLHDIGKSAWWLLLYPTGVGAVLLILWAMIESEPYENDYGNVPNLVRADY